MTRIVARGGIPTSGPKGPLIDILERVKTYKQRLKQNADDPYASYFPEVFDIL